MKIYIIFLNLFLFIYPEYLFSQGEKGLNIKHNSIIGIWQFKTNKISSALGANFQFFQNGKFIYNTSSYDDLNPLRSITGEYLIENNILKLKISKVIVRVEYKVMEADHGFQSGPFQIKGGKLESINQNDKEYSNHELNILDKLNHIKIDEDDYFKLSNDPNKFINK